MNKKRIMGILAVALVCLGIAVVGKILSVDTTGSIVDVDGNTIATLHYADGALSYECEEGYESYVDIVCKEAAQHISEKKLVKKSMCIKTGFQKEVFESIKEAGEEFTESHNRSNLAAAVSDVNGKVLASYSCSVMVDGQNYMMIPAYATSAIKPLSVYAPAIEEGVINWSSKYMDDAYSQIEDEDGKVKDWPLNIDPYTNVEQTVKTAMQRSNNTIAVKILKEYGVEKSCKFLQDKFGMNLETEMRLMRQSGDDEILGNIGMGYLREGVTPLEMLGDYQVFANGGMYQPAYTITEIVDKEGKSYYKHKDSSVRVFTEETAEIMNRLLHTVTEAGGTGWEAGIQGMDICGKTGTGSSDNWFIGMTPEYVCNVWYGSKEKEDGENKAASVFGSIISGLVHDSKVQYPKSDKVREESYCELTGLLANEHCQYTSIGYYSEKNLPKKCNCE